MRRPGSELSVVIRLARDTEQQAAERLRAARERLTAAEARLQSVEAYLAEYRERVESELARTARKVLDLRRFLAQLQATVAAQTRITSQAQHQVDLTRGQWLAARKKREALETLVAERTRAAEQRAEQNEQQLLDDRPAPARPGALRA